MSIYRPDESEFITTRNFVDDFFSDYPSDFPSESDRIYERIVFGNMEPSEYFKIQLEAMKRYEVEQKHKAYVATEIKI